MKSWMVPWILLSALLGWSCASTNVANGIGATYLAIDTIAESVRQECGNTVPDGPCVPESAISTADKQGIKASLEDALEAVDGARAIEAGFTVPSCSSSWECLDTANSVLDAIERILIARGVE